LAVRRVLLPVLIALALAGCGKDDGRAFLDSRTPPSLGPRFWKPDGWAWGVIRVKGAREIRYGVAGPAMPAGKVMVIATGYGESAEVYYETVRDLNARGWAVWVIEPHGQGGSGRFAGARDVGRSAGFDKDAAAIRYLVENVIRPASEDQVTLAAHGSGALAALLALEGGLRRVDRLFLWDALLGAPPAQVLRMAGPMSRFGLGGLRAARGGWKRPVVRLTERNTLPLAWQVANPDLRMGGPGWSWFSAEARAASAATGASALSHVGAAAVVAASDHDLAAARGCRAMRTCRRRDLGGGGPTSTGAVREAWLNALAAADPPAAALTPRN
jgi:lysophospholipase